MYLQCAFLVHLHYGRLVVVQWPRFLLVCLRFIVPLKNFSLILPVKDFKFLPTLSLMAIEQ